MTVEVETVISEWYSLFETLQTLNEKPISNESEECIGSNSITSVFFSENNLYFILNHNVR